MPEAGGCPLDFSKFPLIVPGNESLQMNLKLVDAAASTFLTEYGLTLQGNFVRSGA